MNERTVTYSHSDKTHCYFDVIYDGVKSQEKLPLKGNDEVVNIKGINIEII